jgi:leucyl/phenylalanyl-tRNA--protein transferase
MPVYALSEQLAFPPPRLASSEGLLAIGGDLSEERLLLGYSQGIFPWYSKGEPILWWSPDPRLVLYPREFHVSASLRRVIRRGEFTVTLDRSFREVISSCRRVHLRKDKGTWILPEMIEAYCRLHESGFAHSVEAWKEGRLAGGLYGISLGRCFFGESMFSRSANASKVALAALVKLVASIEFHFIDCQMRTAHLVRLGAREIPRAQYLEELKRALEAPSLIGRWTLDPNVVQREVTE